MRSLVLLCLSAFMVLGNNAYAEQIRSTWKEDSFAKTLQGLVDAKDKLVKQDVLAWYISTYKGRLFGERAVVYVQAKDKDGNEAYYIADLYKGYEKNDDNNWHATWVSGGHFPPEFKRHPEKPTNDKIYALLEENRWNWGCNTDWLDIKGVVRVKIWEQLIGEKPIKFFAKKKCVQIIAN